MKQFLQPEAHNCDPATAKAVILPIPMEKSTSYRKGTAGGPAAILEASTQVEFFDAEVAKDVTQIGIYTDGELANREELNQRNAEEILELIRKRTDHWLEKEKFLLALGGEHTITVGLIEPYLARWGRDLTVVQIDAHADLKDQYEGDPLSHACVMRRLWGRVPIVSVGIRSMDEDEYRLARSNEGFTPFFGHEISEQTDWISQVVRSVKTEKVYLTVDLDGFDPSLIPSVGTPEPGGLSWEQGVGLIRAISQEKKIIGADINELCPGPNPTSDFVAAKLAHKILAYAF